MPASSRSYSSAIPRAESTASLRGHEGTGARGYFEAVPALLLADLNPALKPAGRSRRPPRDPLNSALSFGYALLYRAVLNAVISVGLEPAFGFYHTARSSAHPPVFDLMELFRVWLWDLPLVGSMNPVSGTSDETSPSRGTTPGSRTAIDERPSTCLSVGCSRAGGIPCWTAPSATPTPSRGAVHTGAVALKRM